MVADQTSHPASRLRSRVWIFLLVAPSVFLVDFFTKAAVQRTMIPYTQTIPVVDGIVKLRFIYNEGIAFGLDPSFSPLILVILNSVVILLLLGYFFLSSYDDRPGLVALALVAGGALGNLYDRLLYGRVVDFIECGIRKFTWPVFNVADIAVTCGVILLVLRLLVENRGESCGAGADKSTPEE